LKYGIWRKPTKERVNRLRKNPGRADAITGLPLGDDAPKLLFVSFR
jgi:hypothetical protein